MDNFFSQLKKEAQKIRLSDRERETMRLAILLGVESPERVKSPIRVFPSPYFFFVPRALMQTFAFVLVLAVVGSTTAYAAEGAVPGDLLYQVKVSVNESVRAALAVSNESKANWHAEAAERRMKEAQVLSARGTLTAEINSELEENFEKHAAGIEDVVDLIEKKNPIIAADISARFNSSIEAHSSVIARLGEMAEDEDSRRESESLSRFLRGRGRKIARREDEKDSLDKEKIERALDDLVKVKVFLEAQDEFPDHALLPLPDHGKEDADKKKDKDKSGSPNKKDDDQNGGDKID